MLFGPIFVKKWKWWGELRHFIKTTYWPNPKVIQVIISINYIFNFEIGSLMQNLFISILFFPLLIIMSGLYSFQEYSFNFFDFLFGNKYQIFVLHHKFTIFQVVDYSCFRAANMCFWLFFLAIPVCSRIPDLMSREWAQ